MAMKPLTNRIIQVANANRTVMGQVAVENFAAFLSYSLEDRAEHEPDRCATRSMRDSSVTRAGRLGSPGASARLVAPRQALAHWAA
jgi:hypothetical protein